MAAVGLANATVNNNANVDVLTFGQISNIDTTQNIGGTWAEGDSLFVDTTAGQLTKTQPSGETSQVQKIGKIEKVHASTGIILIQGAGRSNATPNLDDGKIFIGDASNYSTTSTLDTSIVPESTNLYYTDARADARVNLQTGANLNLSSKSTSDLAEGTNLYYTDTRFDTRLATKTTSNLSEGSNLYYTDARVDAHLNQSNPTAGYVLSWNGSDYAWINNTGYTSFNTDFDTRLALKSTSDLSEGNNLYYTDARADTRVAANVIDEDDMVTDSETKTPSQQSVKSFVEGQSITINGTSVSLGGSVTVGETKPTITSISPSTIDNTESTITITGSNFISGTQVEFINTATGIWYPASTITFNNSTSLTITITLSVDAQYRMRIENPDGNAVISSTNILTVSDAPTWTTASGSLGTFNGNFSGTLATVVATSDSAVTFSEVGSNLATANVTLSSAGVLSTTDFGGSSTTATTYNFTIRATDAEGQTADRSFNLTSVFGATGGGQFN
jgi:hypothetical protein